MKQNNKNLFFLIFGTVCALIPSFLIRFNENIYNWLYLTFGTYPSDLWNFFANYLQKGLHYPPEYPAGLRCFYEIFNFYQYDSYFWFFTVNCVILALFACGTTYLLWKIICRSEYDPQFQKYQIPNQVRDDKKTVNSRSFDKLKIGNSITNIWYFWILAPSFLFYGLYNYDLPVVFLIVLGVYLFLRKKYSLAVTSLAIGTVIKVFPVFLLPIFILKSPKRDWLKLFLIFSGVVLICNLSYMINNFETWIYPYIWQISQNVSSSAKAGTYWWIFYPILGKNIGVISLALFTVLYYFTYKALNKASFINLCIAVVIIFLATDRIYSPQYNLYLLPFLALATYKIDKKWFYMLEIASVLHVATFFYLTSHVILLQILIAIKYISLIFLFKNNFIQSKKLLMTERKG